MSVIFLCCMSVGYYYYCYFFRGFILGVVVSPSVYFHLPSIFRDPMSLLLVFWCCEGFTLPRKYLFCHFLGPWGRQAYAPGPAIVIQSCVSFKFFFSECMSVCYFLSVIHSVGHQASGRTPHQVCVTQC